MSGASVQQIQEQLRAKGFNVTVDGKYGPETDAAVRAFQKASGAKVDGIVGPETMGKLFGPCHAGVSDGVDRGPQPGNGTTKAAPTEAEKNNAPPGTVRAGDLARADEARRSRGADAPTPVEPNPGAPGAVNLAPAGASEAERYAHYAAIVRQNGGEVCPSGRPTVLGLRGLSSDGAHHATSSSRSYDDTFVVLTPDGHVREFSGATHPGQNRSTMSPDVTGDGVGDVGMIKPGNYDVVPNGQHAGNASYHVRTSGGSGNLPGWRDTNQDGRMSDAERAASDQRGDTLNGVLFHQGSTYAPTSIGCQTMSPETYNAFMSAMGGPGQRFSYTLVDAS
jgi:hypothetical protein